MSTLALFLPLAKVDADQRLVQGIATAEKPDRAGEICDYASTKPYFEAWSAEAEAASGGKSLGAVRAMHSPIAAGKLTDITFDDDEKRIVVEAKIVDDDEWEKVMEGVYTGFSQGGRYIARWEDPETGLTRYTAEPIEISLVDVPCLPDATFEMVRNGVSEFRKFAIAQPAPAASPAPEAPAPAAPSTPAPEAPVAPAAPAQLAFPVEALGKAALALSAAAEKLERAIDENSRLRKVMAEFEPRLGALESRLTKLEAQPQPARAALRSAPREADFGFEASRIDGVEAAIKQLAALPDEQRALALTKVSLANPLLRRF
ncbi:MAG: hypothetical protein ACLPN5_19435 [Roseiarcus sp.]